MAMSRAGRTRPTSVTTRAARFAAGKQLRRRLPRSAHAPWKAPSDRPDPIDLIERMDRSRVARLLPIRYGRMAESAFAFLRGAAGIMAHDLAGTPTTGLRVQLCGDAHIANFGVFATPERDRVFDVNDFDETLAGPWEWDIKRLATSLVLAGRFRRFTKETQRKAARLAVRAYRRALLAFAAMRYLDAWYAHIDLSTLAQAVPHGGRRDLSRALERAVRRTGYHAFPHLAESVRGTYRIRDEPPLIMHYRNSADREASTQFYEHYLDTLSPERRMLLERYHLVDVAQKVVGVGSVGTVCSVLLLMADDDVPDPLFLQVKQAQASALEEYVGESPYENHAERVVVGQRLIQEASDILLGWSRLGTDDFYVRQLRDMKFVTDPSSLGPRSLIGHGEACGAALARAHARTGDPSRIAGYLGNGSAFDEAVTAFAAGYADQVERDHAALVRAIRSGRLPSRAGV